MGDVARELLAERERHRVHQVRAADLLTSAKLSAFRPERREVAGPTEPGDRVISSTAAMCIAVGNVSLEDWDMLTSSLGCTGILVPITPPASSMARFEMTSFDVHVGLGTRARLPDAKGKLAVEAPSITSRAARSISVAARRRVFPESLFTSAEANFKTPKARISAGGMVRRRSQSGEGSVRSARPNNARPVLRSPPIVVPYSIRTSLS